MSTDDLATDTKAARKAERARRKEARRKFWTQPIGQTLHERKGGTWYSYVRFGTVNTGVISLGNKGDLTYLTFPDNQRHVEKFHADDVVSASIETAADYVERTSGGRVAGGAVAGTVLLGPLGLALGAGAGALAKKKYGAAEFLIIELSDGRVVTVEVARKHAVKARELRDAIASRQ